MKIKRVILLIFFFLVLAGVRDCDDNFLHKRSSSKVQSGFDNDNSSSLGSSPVGPAQPEPTPLPVPTPNTAPTISSILDQEVDANSSLLGVNFSILDSEESLDCSTSVSVSSSDTSIIDASGIVVSGVAPNCTINLNPKLNQYGNLNLTVAVTDGILSTEEVLSLNVKFLPNAVPGIFAWYDGADTSAVIEAGGVGTGVTQWRDKTSNNIHITPTATGVRPKYNTANYVDFDGTTVHLGNPLLILTDSYTLVFAGTPRGTVSTLMRGSANHHPFIVLINEAGVWGNAGGSSFGGSGVDWTIGTFAMGSLVHDGVLNTFDFGFNGDISASTNIASSIPDITNQGFMYVGGLGPTASQDWGKLNELIIVNDKVSNSDREALEGYVACKWGLQANLPVGHPYAVSCP